MEFLICKPDFFDISYEINPHMNVKVKSNDQISANQWNSLRDAIYEAGGTTIEIEPQKEFPDMVFTANAGLLIEENRFVLSKFKYKERQGEERYFEDFLSSIGYKVEKSIANFEGAGDALFFNGQLIGGYGFRTAPEVYREIDVPVSTVRLIDPRFYHLDTCFCPLMDQDYIINTSAFDQYSLETIRLLGEREIAVPEDEAIKFACNAVLVNETVILPEGCPTTVEKLESFGYKTISVAMTEFLKSGGACKCLTLRID